MTDMVNGITQNQDTQVSQSVSSSPATSGVSQAPSQFTSEEKTFRQSEVNDIVGRAKHEAVERFKRADNAAPQQNNVGLSTDEIRRITAEETTRLRDEWQREAYQKAQYQEAEKVANEFLSKLKTGKDKYSDFDNVVGDVDFQYIPHIVQLANSVDNTHDVMYELAKQPTKLANLQQLMAISEPLARKEMQRLSQSIKDNEAAAGIKLPNEPLSQLRPSNVGTDNGAMTVGDYRKKYRG